MIMRTLLITLFVFPIILTADELQTTFDKLSDDQWLVWEIAIAPESGWHCWGHGYSRSSSPVTNTLTLYWRKDEFNLATNQCDIELTGPVKHLTNVSVQHSAQFISKQLNQQWSNDDKEHMLHALALHRDATAILGLKTFFSQHANEKQRQLINLFMSSYWEQEGFDFVAGQLETGLSFEREKSLIFALSQSPVAAAQTVVFQRAKQGTSREIRKEAIFWFSQFNSTGIAGKLVELLETEKDQGLLEHIVFAIAQVKEGAGLDTLMQLIRTSSNDKVRQQALFWLAHSDDEKAMPILEQLLVGEAQ